VCALIVDRTNEEVVVGELGVAIGSCCLYYRSFAVSNCVRLSCDGCLVEGVLSEGGWEIR